MRQENIPAKPVIVPRKAQSKSGSTEAHLMLPSSLTTCASSILAGSETQPYSPESQENPPQRVLPPTPIDGVRQATTKRLRISILQKDLFSREFCHTRITRRCLLHLFIILPPVLTSTERQDFVVKVKLKLIESSQANDDIFS